MTKGETIQHVVCLEELDSNLSAKHKLGYFALGFRSLGLQVTPLDVIKYKKVHQHPKEPQSHLDSAERSSNL